ncbi:MAG: NADH-quinone oxidoreductase subunit I [Candidatus Krumholzibacteriia bacterium]
MVRYFADIYQAVTSTFKGMGVTFKHLWKKPVTQQYPDERWALPPRFKGFVFNDMNKCNACNQCVKACPVSCIYLETEGKGKERVMTRYAIDYNKCIWCGFCVEPCPDDALSMSHDYDHSVYFRDSLVYEYVAADRPIPTNREARIAAGLWVKPKDGPAADKPEKAAGARTRPARAAGEAKAEPADRSGGDGGGPRAAEKKAAAAPPPPEMPASAPEEPPCEGEEESQDATPTDTSREAGDETAGKTAPADPTQGRDT